MNRRGPALLLALVLTGNTAWSPAAQAGGPVLPVPGAMVRPSAAATPVLVRGLTVHAGNPLLFDFLMDTGTTDVSADSPAFRVEAQRLVDYFLAALAMQDSDLWVNLSPYERERVIPGDLGRTALGRDMLAQDYLLKQFTASLLFPEQEPGRGFWRRVFARARNSGAPRDVPLDALAKVWIVVDRARVVERDNTVAVAEAHLKVMLDKDYVAARAAALPRGQRVGPDAPGAALDIRKDGRGTAMAADPAEVGLFSNDLAGVRGHILRVELLRDGYGEPMPMMAVPE